MTSLRRHTKGNRTGRMNAAYADGTRRTQTGVKVRSVVCPDCLADIDDPCLRSGGSTMHGYHASRKRMATRRRNEETDHKAVAWVTALTHNQRRMIRKAAGLTLEQLAEALGNNKATLVRQERGVGLATDIGVRYCEWLEAQPREMASTAEHVYAGMDLEVDGAWCKVVSRTLLGPLVVVTVFGEVTGMQTFTLDPKEEVQVRFQ